MLPVSGSRTARARQLLEKIGSALFDDDDPESEGLIPPRHRDRETPRQRYVRDMETRWAEFHQAENDEGDGLLVILVKLAAGFAAFGLFAIGRWVLHLSYAQQWKLFTGPALIYVAWILWSRNRPPEKK
jgi:hypothetical protein